MAVYKSTRCYPFLNSLDTRVVQEIGSTEKPVQYLKCKVDTSNKKVTGYKIRILDSNNNVIFEPNYISPISELKDGEMATIYQSNGINSGLNGTYLYIPFFQSDENKKTSSYNAMYYIPKYHVDHIVMDQALCRIYNSSLTLKGAEDINNSLWSESSGQLYYNDGDVPVYLDGELVLEGQTVLFAVKTNNVHGISLGIYQVIKEQQGTTWYTAFKKVKVVKDQEITTVIRGKNFHNSNWKNNNGVYSPYQQEVYKVFTEGSTENKIAGLSLEGALYKWEITLYQGQGEESEDTPGLITYSTLDNANYDMVAASGTILGSSSTRVQIASLPAFTTAGDVNNTILPGLKEGTLVLQGTYMNFGNFSQGEGKIFNTLRHYVKSYDASYGHAYPLEGSVSPSEIEYNERVQFFKYTNDYDAIKEQDVVAYGVKYNIEFHLYDYDRSTITEKNSMADFESVGVNNRRYGINKMDLPEYVRNQIEEGDEILFTGQETNANWKTYPYENGVYRVYKINNTDNTEDADVSNILFLKRAASFNTWGSFIGKIIFCQCYIENSSSGSGSALNIESLAGASADSNLWNPDENSLSSGSGNLYFTQESPIMLFESLLEGRKYDLRLDPSWNTRVTDLTPVERYGGSVCDGVNLEEGMLVVASPIPPSDLYDPKMRVLKVVINNNNQLCYINLGEFQAENENNYYYVLQGKTYGKRVYVGDSSAPNWDLYTGYILKNDCYQTYISPFVNVLPDMKIKFLNNKKAHTVEGYSSWLPIQKVNNTVYCVFNGGGEGGYLENPLESEISLSNGTPWKYEVRTFFKASDGNPFYSYENPYLILYKNNQPYSTLFKNEEEEYWVLKNILGEEPFGVKKESDETTYQNFILNTLKDPTAVYGRSVKFSADYIQFDGLSWESYRWLLYNEDGDLLQDTGKKFDKTISVIFYGLSDDRTQAAIYYAVLEVRDEKQNQNIYVIKFHVEPAQKVKGNINFQASFDCNIHAMKLDFSQFGRVKPSFRNEGEDYVILDNYGTNGGILFEEGIGAEIYNKVNAPIDYTYGSNISHNNGEENNELTFAGINGAPYYTTFNPNETSHDTEDSQSLFVEKQENDIADKGSFYFETAVCLDDNFCGSIVSWSVEKESNSEAQYPYLTAEGEEFSKNGFINFELMSAENFLFNSEATSGTNYSLNPDRNQLLFKISVDENGNSKTVVLQNITLFDINEIGARSYYSMQPNNCITDNIKNSAYEYLEYDLSYYPGTNQDQNKNELYINRDSQGQFFAGNEDFFLTNLCMASETIKNNGKSFSYWDETRPFLTEASTNSKILQNMKLQFVEGVRDSDSHTDNGVQYWPSVEEESSLYWVERDDIEESPICWSDVLATDSHVTQMFSLKRHYGMSRYGYRLICQIKNVEDLYELISEDEDGLLISQETEAGQQVLSLTDQEDNDYGTITIVKYLI